MINGKYTLTIHREEREYLSIDRADAGPLLGLIILGKYLLFSGTSIEEKRIIYTPTIYMWGYIYKREENMEN